MDRRRFLLTSLAGVLATPLAAEAQQAGKVYRIGYLSYLGCSDDPFKGPFLQGLRDAGYVEGRNVVIECRSAPGKTDRYPDLAAELVRLKVDVLLATGTIMTLAAKQATTTVPIVMVYVDDPVASGIVSNLARPGANVTGLSMLAAEMAQKNLELLKEAALDLAGQRIDRFEQSGPDIARSEDGGRSQDLGGEASAGRAPDFGRSRRCVGGRAEATGGSALRLAIANHAA
jgi:putative tryptophan/tyrosine transport system substrate-binding protein